MKGGAMNKLFALIAVVGLTFGLAACPEKKEEPKPTEPKAGEGTGEKTGETGEKTGETGEKAGETGEKAGQ